MTNSTGKTTEDNETQQSNISVEYSVHTRQKKRSRNEIK